MSGMKEKFPEDGCACLRAKAPKQAFFFPSKAEPFGSLFLPVAGFFRVQKRHSWVKDDMAWRVHIGSSPVGAEQEGIDA
jgi:hypothetical protein